MTGSRRAYEIDFQFDRGVHNRFHDIAVPKHDWRESLATGPDARTAADHNRQMKLGNPNP
jgi:hypothetical protein